MSERQEIEAAIFSDPMAKAEAERMDQAAQAERLAEHGEALRHVESFIRRFLILPVGLPLVLALWSLATHLFEAFDAFPYMAISSPVKRCGKTRLAEVLELLTARSERTAGLSEAVLFRLLDDKKPTLYIDEAESLRSTKSERAEALRAILNAGYRRGHKVYRCVGQSHTPVGFEVYSPKVIIAIGSLPDTLADRSIPVVMRRRRSGEPVERFITRRVKPEAEVLRTRFESAAKTCAGKAQAVYENPAFDIPGLEDREAELWSPLFAVASVLSPARIRELNETALRLAGTKAQIDKDDSLALRLLSDLRAIWPQAQGSAFTAELLARLKGLEEAPWSAEDELNPRKLASMLRPFGVSRRDVRVGEKNGKGYVREELEGVWEAYIPPEDAPNR